MGPWGEQLIPHPMKICDISYLFICLGLFRCAELEQQLEKIRLEAEGYRKQLTEAHQVAMFQAQQASQPIPLPGPIGSPMQGQIRPLPPAKPPSLGPSHTSPRTSGTVILGEHIKAWLFIPSLHLECYFLECSSQVQGAFRGTTINNSI